MKTIKEKIHIINESEIHKWFEYQEVDWKVWSGQGTTSDHTQRRNQDSSNAETKNKNFLKLRNPSSVKSFLTGLVKHLPIYGLIIQAKPLELAKILGPNDFKSSNECLERYPDITCKTVLANLLISILKERLSVILKDYAPKNVLKADETGLYYSALPTKTYALKIDIVWMKIKSSVIVIGCQIRIVKKIVCQCANTLSESQT